MTNNGSDQFMYGGYPLMMLAFTSYSKGRLNSVFYLDRSLMEHVVITMNKKGKLLEVKHTSLVL